MYSRRERIFIMIASIIVLDVYVPALPFDLLRPPPPPYLCPTPACPFFLSMVYLHMYLVYTRLYALCIHTYIYMHTHTHRETYTRTHTWKRRDTINTRSIYMYMYVPFPTRKAYLTTINHAKFFAQFIRVADIEDTRRNAVFC